MWLNDEKGLTLRTAEKLATVLDLVLVPREESPGTSMVSPCREARPVMTWRCPAASRETGPANDRRSPQPVQIIMSTIQVYTGYDALIISADDSGSLTS